MPKEIFPSSYECDCGHQSHFFENTIREMKAMSRKKKVRLLDYMFRDLGLHRVIASCDVDNLASVRLLERVGMRREAHCVENIWFKGAWGPCCSVNGPVCPETPPLKLPLDSCVAQGCIIMLEGLHTIDLYEVTRCSGLASLPGWPR